MWVGRHAVLHHARTPCTNKKEGGAAETVLHMNCCSLAESPYI